MSEPSITIGVLSDTHSWLDASLVEVFVDHDVDAIIHAGDIGDASVLERLEEVAPVTAVKGNIDGGDLRFLPEETVLEAKGARIGVRHISGNPNRPHRAAREFIQREGLDALIVGHSHIPVVGRVDGALWVNPGAAGRHGFHDERFAAFLHVDSKGGFGMDRIHLGRRAEAFD
jgi:hypothetical protein